MKLVSSFTAFLVFSIMFFSPRVSAQQDDPLKLGDIPRGDLEMMSWPSDTNASAVILNDFGTSAFNDDMEISTKFHVRIKILNEKGYQFGTIVKTLYTGEGGEAIQDIAGATYQLTPDGQLITKKLSSKDIFEEKIDSKHRRVKFTLPALSPGCVIEYKYEIISGDLLQIPKWSFQWNEPVRISEYHLQVPINFAYSAVARGCDAFTTQDIEETQQLFQGKTKSYLSNDMVKCKRMNYVMENIPALRDEPYTTTIENYRDRVEFQLNAYMFPGERLQKVVSTWEKFVAELLKSNEFGGKIDNTKAMRKIVDTVIAGKNDAVAKMTAIYSWVAKSIATKNAVNIIADQDISDVLESKSATSTENCFLLISMLRYAGISADPVLLSTREHGKIQNLYPIVDQFNYVLTRAKIGDKTYYLDATNPLRPYDELPTKVMDVLGIIIKPEPVEWATITCDKQYVERTATTIKLKPDGSLDGEMIDVFQQYAALFNRANLKEKKDIDIAKSYLGTEKNGIQVDSLVISGKEAIDQPLSVTAKISSASYVQSSGDILYFNPHLQNRHYENEFKSERRKFPIEFAYLSDIMNAVTVIIPDSFEVKDMLPDKTMSAAEGSLWYTRQSKMEDGRLQILYRFQVKQNTIEAIYYNLVRNFINQIVASESEQLVIRRKQPPVAPVAAAPVSEETKAAPAVPEKKATGSKKKGR